MKKRIAVLAGIGLCWAQGIYGADLQWENMMAQDVKIQCILVEDSDPGLIYVGSKEGILKSTDGGAGWRRVFSTGAKSGVNFLSSFAHSIYAATDKGLYQSSDQGRHWRRIFKGKNNLESQCVVMAVSSSGVYLGTKAGLFVSYDKGRLWHKNLANTGIYSIVYSTINPGQVYLACSDGVLRSIDFGRSWERVFAASSVSSIDDQPIADQDELQKQDVYDAKYLSNDPNNEGHLYFSDGRKVFSSSDSGQGWVPLSDYGLFGESVRFLTVSADSLLLCATGAGVFKYTKERWEELSLNLSAQKINFLATSNHGTILAATDQGLFKSSQDIYSNEQSKRLFVSQAKEVPDILDIQKKAIQYAEVEPEKILEWRRKAKLKAMLPHLNVSIDNSKKTNYEIYTSATAKYVYEGPCDESRGWDVTLSWELGDLIWNEDQTNIDVRSKLMVELRDDILDEVTRLYYERLRTQAELGSLGIEERKRRREKELRLQEVTAMLDGLTGGYFSKRLRQE